MKKLKLALIGFIITGLFAIILAGCGTQTAKTEDAKKQTLLETIQKRGTLKIGTEGTYPPFTFKNEKGELQGFDVEIIIEVAKRLGVKAEFVPTEWKAMFAGLDSERFDVIANQISINEKRLEKYDLSTPYTVSGAQVIVNKETTNISSVEDLKGRKVGVTQSSNWEEIAQKAGANIRHYKGANEIFADLQAKRIEATVNDRLFIAEYFLKNSSHNLAVAGQTFDEAKMGFAFRKGSPELIEAVNKAIREIQADGTYVKISHKWFGQDVSK
ncbi:transporter substrate-binding domain-containing protein [Acetonema longum]|uniref:Amino acid ABC transporter periplasmic protein n=1 Tax=Acetonema longum DSM 6540 TaxID=1009370 RepID=F7NHD1_9FIRM|nr:transporter substrate-binding domain-containing protein [Acetonema longum]EGO64614.1 amino acid ABC transporter periplasmic protein [Acetonema longum DSM 6540]